MVRFSSYMIFLLCLGIVLYVMAPVSKYDLSTESLASKFFTTDTIVAIIIGVVTGMGISLLTGFAAIYAIPASILLQIIWSFVYPFSFIPELASGTMFYYILMAVYNLLLLLAVLSFIRGET